MDAHKASELINSLHFMPGWEFHATVIPQIWDDVPAQLKVELWVDTVNSNREMALQDYPQEITIAPSMAINPKGIHSENELYAGLLMWAGEVFMHEAREFLRVGDDMQAPFHPHKSEGDTAWIKARQEMMQP